ARGTGRFTEGRILASAAAGGVSLLRGTRRTAARVHTRQDGPEGLAFRTAAAVGEALAAI
ncbi:MAG TPA: hypothetical protein VJ773_04590, partial [Gemmatimonadales bacterium]|nr:hypothetical protein [Gemmatimonadales bacterium]